MLIWKFGREWKRVPRKRQIDLNEILNWPNREMRKLNSRFVGNMNRGWSRRRQPTSLISLSEQNDPEDQYLLGLKYYKGENVEQDMERAINLWGSSLSNGREATIGTLRDCIEDLTRRIKETSDSQEYEKAVYFQTLIDRCENLCNTRSQDI